MELSERPRRSILFAALAAEERNKLGSDYFTNVPPVPAESMIANISMDVPLFLYPMLDSTAFGAEASSMRE